MNKEFDYDEKHLNTLDRPSAIKNGVYDYPVSAINFSRKTVFRGHCFNQVLSFPQDISSSFQYGVCFV